MSETTLVPLCPVADVSPDLPVRVEQGGTAYAVFLVDDLPYVTADVCTHGPGSMSEGYAAATGRLGIGAFMLTLKNWLLSAVKSKGAVSPLTRATASNTPVTIPARAAR